MRAAPGLVAPRTVRSDDMFFPAMTVLILGIVVSGFAQSYFFAGMVFAKLPNALVHVHGALLVSWIVLLLVQTTLVAAGRVKWHRTLGLLGFVLPPFMFAFGVLTLFDSIRRNGTGIPAEIILVGDLGELLVFAALTFWGILARRNATDHKRLMILGTLAILGPAIDRWHVPIGIVGTLLIYVSLPLLVLVYDLWARRRIARSTAVGVLAIFVQSFTLLPLARLGVWHGVVSWILRS